MRSNWDVDIQAFITVPLIYTLTPQQRESHSKNIHPSTYSFLTLPYQDLMMAQPREQEFVQRHQCDGRKVAVGWPSDVAKHQQLMGEVDRSDQLRQYHMVQTKYYKYIVQFLFEASITNSYIFYLNYTTAPKLPLKEYHLQLAKDLVGDFHSKKHHDT